MSTGDVSKSIDQLAKFTEILTSVLGQEDGHDIRVVLSWRAAQDRLEWGGYASDAAAIAAALDAHDIRRADALNRAYEYYLGWRAMMRNTWQMQAGVNNNGKSARTNGNSPTMCWHTTAATRLQERSSRLV